MTSLIASTITLDSTWAMLYTWFLLGPKTREIWANRCGFTTGEADLPTIHAFVHFPIFTTPQQLDYLYYTPRNVIPITL